MSLKLEAATEELLGTNYGPMREFFTLSNKIIKLAIWDLTGWSVDLDRQSPVVVKSIKLGLLGLVDFFIIFLWTK